MPYFDLSDDVQLYYEEQGQGQPLIFMHGVWMSGRFFQKQLPALGQKYRTIALDMRGHGQSSHVHYGHTVATYAQDVRAFIDGLGLEDVILAGWSMGCFVIWDYFRQFGAENIKATILIDESASDFKWDDWALGFADLPTLAHIMSLVQTNRTAFLKDFIPSMFKIPPGAEDTRWMLEETTRLPESIASAIIFDQTVQDYREDLSKVTVPSLLCFGRDEKLIPVAAAEHLHLHLPNARLVIFEESSHCPFLEEPEEFNQTVETFIEALD